jgi:hypothetical protein
MENLEAYIEEVLSNDSWDERQKKDELYRIDCKMYTNLGTDSTKSERNEVKKKSRLIYKAIQKINPHEGTQLLQAIDK